MLTTHDEGSDVRSKAKQGTRNLLPGPCLSVKLSLMRKHLVQLDRLAVEIRAAHGTWITRSGIVTAILEAAAQAAAIPESQAICDEAVDEQPKRS